MVKLDVTLLRYLSPDDFRILTAVEMGMKNHELVPGLLINSIATLKFGGGGKILVDLTKHKLLAYERGKRYDGYRLTYHGYDFLSLNVLTARNVISGVGNQIGVGKESDVFIAQSSDNEQRYALKFHRLGRVCFRKVSEKRDYYTKSKCKTNWIYLSRKAAQREYEFLMFMHCKNMPVPKPIDHNRHVVVMELIDGTLLNHFTLDSFEPDTRDVKLKRLYDNLMDLILRFANETRVIHGDFNEFNILIKNQTCSREKQSEEMDPSDNDLVPIIIDLPQMIGVDHDLAPEYFERDVNCVVGFFAKRFHFTSDRVPTWDDVDTILRESNPMDDFLNDVYKNSEKQENGEKEVHINENYNASYETEKESDLSKSQMKVNRNNYDELVENDIDSIGDHETQADNMNDLDDCLSQFSAVTITPDEARRKVRAELLKRELNRKKREAAKPKNIKGDANPVRRKRKTNSNIACEDMASYPD
ncbi:Serine/threonine-protein kinase RIO2, partial [Fragariocoptes setiger]